MVGVELIGSEKQHPRCTSPACPLGVDEVGSAVGGDDRLARPRMALNDQWSIDWPRHKVVLIRLQRRKQGRGRAAARSRKRRPDGGLGSKLSHSLTRRRWSALARLRVFCGTLRMPGLGL